MSKSDSKVRNVTGPEPRAVHLYQTDPVDKDCTSGIGSEDSSVAPTLLPVVDPDAPEITVADVKLSFAGLVGDGGTEPEAILEEKELASAIGSFVSALPDAEKAVFIRRYWYLASIGEISEKLGSSKAGIKSTLFRTRRKLRIYLQEEGLC